MTHTDVRRPLRMAAALGIRLDRMLGCRAIYPEELERVVRRCLGCRGERECRLWLAARPRGAAQAPSYCRNRAFFAELKS